MHSAKPLLYGANGFCGARISQEIERSIGAVTALGTSRRTTGEMADLRKAFTGHSLVLNCAGPFAESFHPVVDACLDVRTHYLDICAEWAVFEALRDLDAQARERDVMLLPGVGFDVVATDCLAAYVGAKLPGATRLEIGIAGLELLSRGSARTMMGLIGQPVRLRREGRIVSDARLLETKFDFGRGPQPAYAVSWGDISTAYHTTGIPNVTVFFEATPAIMGLAVANRAFGWMFRNPATAQIAQAQVERLPSGPSTRMRAERKITIVARVEDDDGRRVESRLVTPEAYTFTIESSVAISKRVIEGEIRPGFQTPAKLLGPDFVLELPGVERVDLL